MIEASTDKPITFAKEEITGIKVQYLKVIFTNVKDNDKFIVATDVGKIEFNEKRISDEGDIQIELAIPKNSRQIIIKYEREGTISEAYKLEISVQFKFKILLRKIFSIFKRSVIVFGRGMRFLWREHHMIVPPALWKKYILKFIRRVKERGEILWNPFIQDDYHKWISIFENNIEIKQLKYNPLMSILIPVYNVKRQYLFISVSSILFHLSITLSVYQYHTVFMTIVL